ncbi:MAG: PAS domain S-box protein [Acidobacteria bacterium]|nr:PAS domain S-box protein [Acidobacteriota bacterium]
MGSFSRIVNADTSLPAGDLSRLLAAKPLSLLTWSFTLLAIVIILDYLILDDVSLGVLYIVPMLPAAVAFSRWQILGFALFLALLRSVFVNATSPTDAFLRFLMGLLAYAATGLFVEELVRNRRLILHHSVELEQQANLRREAESHLKALAQSNPAAILTLDEEGRILAANRATAELLALPPQDLPGRAIASHLPVLADALSLRSDLPTFRTAAQCQGRRGNGSLFVAHTWFSTYSTPNGRRLAAIAVDVSDEVREREEQNLRQLLLNNKIVAAAVSHEMRNVCGAIQLVHTRLSADPKFQHQDDLRVLNGLVEALSQIASTELRLRASESLPWIDVNEVLNQLRIIIQPDWDDAGASIRWNVPASLPPARGESYGVLQSMMNLAQNSLRAVAGAAERRLEISASSSADTVIIQLTDSGHGVVNPSRLFTAFYTESGHTGLGLYVSRAILRSYGGDLRHVPTAHGAAFQIELSTARHMAS